MSAAEAISVREVHKSYGTVEVLPNGALHLNIKPRSPA